MWAVGWCCLRKNTGGQVYVKFKEIEGASKARQALHNRWFAGKPIGATFMVSMNTVLSLALALTPCGTVLLYCTSNASLGCAWCMKETNRKTLLCTTKRE